MDQTTTMQQLDLPLNRDLFLRTLIRELAGTLEEVVGYEEAAGYISLVGQHMGDWINALYTKELGVVTLNRQQVAEILVDLKQRIHGNFSIVEQNNEKIVLQSTSCPFEDKVLDRPSMCMMTSNVFGVITAANLGYAKVVLEETIAKGCGHCRVVVHTKQGPEADAAQGREYYGT
ncbi:MAG: methanogen output domain 1-containing protein [Deltaproteobacteria bacterium]|nr:methanogen output domain 1-containing protein [Deltaproteobacteria bacterium]